MHRFYLLPSGLLATLLLGSPNAASAQQTWAPYFGNTHFGFSTGAVSTGRSPAAVALADLDHDGDMDAVVAQTNFATGFAMLRNLGAGYYAPPVQYPSGDEALQIVVGDFTGDGHPDVVVPKTGSFGGGGNTVALFAGVGDGTFGAPVTYAVGNGPVGLAAADFNGDGQLDLAVANYGNGNGNTISLLLGDTITTFAPALTLPAGTAPYHLAAGQLNADALPDLAVANEDQRVRLLLNTGGGTFQDSAYQLPNPNFAGSAGAVIALADVDQDQDLDVWYSSNGTRDSNRGYVVIRRNNGAGVLDTATMRVPFEDYSTGTSSMAVADLNADGLPDLVTASASGRVGDGYRVQLNLGNGAFGPATVRPGGQRTQAVAVADGNGDTKPDVFTIDDYSLLLTVHPNPGNGQFPSQTLFTAGIPGFSGMLEVGDVNGDGDLDVVTSSNSRTTIAVPVAVVSNTGNATFGAGQQVASAGVQAKLRDLDGDGDLDLLFAGGTGSTGYRFSTAMNSGNGTFATPVSWNVGVCGTEDVDAADMDNDGDVDVVATGGCSGGAVYIVPNLGGGTFGTAVEVGVSGFSGPLALGDFDEDGQLDVAAGNSDGIDVLVTDSVGTPGSPTRWTMDEAPFDIMTADLNDDGHLDLASCNYGSGPGDYSMTLRLGNGDGTFQAVQLFAAAYSPDLANVSGIAAGDIDGDFDLDIMVSNNASNDLSIFLNQGGGQFSSSLRAGLYYGARAPWFADLNNDGHCEIVALVSLPPGGFQDALVVLPGASSGLRTGGTAPTVLGTPGTTAAPQLTLSAAPNPFGHATALTFSLPRRSDVRVTLHDALGRVVARPFRGTLSAGSQTLTIGRDRLAAGLYYARLEAAGQQRTVKLVVE